MNLVAIVGSGCIALAAALPAFAEPPAPLIPRSVLFGNPERAGVQISHDGRHISYVAPLEGVLNVWVAPVESLQEARAVTSDKVRGITNYFWSYNNTHILYMQDKGGDENWHVYSVNLETGEEIDLSPFPGARASVHRSSHHHPNEVLLSVNNRDPSLSDLHRVNVVTGEREVVVENSGFAGFMSDDMFRVRYATRIDEDGNVIVTEPDASGGWTKVFLEIPQTDSITTNLIEFDKEGKHLFMLDSRGRDTAALFEMTLGTGQTRELASDPRADLDGVFMHPTENRIQAVSFTYDRVQWKVLDESIRSDLEFLRGLNGGDIEVTSRTLDDTKWTVAYIQDNGPVRYYLYDREAATNKARFLFTNRPALEDVTLARMHPVVIKSRDGLNLVTYLTLPSWTDTDEDMRPDEPLPMVLFVHGGPWARDEWGYNPYHQWLANRGYAVLSVNFRGSTGFGKAFINAGNMEWAGKMHDDLIDAVEWAVKSKVAHPERVAIMGGSYGGYSTLVGLTFTPDVFACGVDIVGPSNIVTLLNSIPPYWKPIRAMFTKRVGDDSTPEGRKFLEERSPLTHVSKITKPLLIGQGANDPRVKQAESDQIVDAMKRHNIPVTYVLFPDEGHGFRRPQNNTSFNAVTEIFLAQHLSGRYQPIDDDFKGSSIQVPEGAEHVPGVAESLTK